MKRTLIYLMLMAVSLVSFAQEKTEEPKSSSKALEFLNRDGSFIQKEFYDVGSIKGVKCQVLILTDLVKKEKMGCIRLETSYYSSYSKSSDTYIGTLDYDELDACIQCVNYINETLLPSSPIVYTETEYKTRDNVKVGAFYNEKKKTWSAFVYTKGYTSRSAEFFDSENLTTLVTIMNRAKTMIKEYTSK